MEGLAPHEKYLEAGVHICTRVSTKHMRKFVYKYRKDKLVMLNVDLIDKRITDLAKILAKYDLSKVAVIASRVYAVPAARKFSELTGAKAFVGRFVPGTFTNPSRKDFFEPEVVFVCDPRVERQALIEATELGVLTVGLADTDNSLKYLDYFIPCNNKGKKSVPFVFYLFTRELMKAKGLIKGDEEFVSKFEDFELGGSVAASADVPEGAEDEASALENAEDAAVETE
jgi:small subunit ribosomal protein S2